MCVYVATDNAAEAPANVADVADVYNAGAYFRSEEGGGEEDTTYLFEYGWMSFKV